MLKSIRLASVCATLALAATPALAQSNFKCVGGELLGGPQGFVCDTDSAGNIINVQPRALQQAAPTTQAAPAAQTRTQTTTVYRGGTPTTVHTPRSQDTYTTTHQAQTRYVTRSATPTAHPPVTRTYRPTHAPTTRTYSTYTTRSTYTHKPAPTVTYTPAPQRVAPTPRSCGKTLQRLRDTRDGRRQIEVCYSDLDPLSLSGADALYNRLQTAARRACRGGSSLSLISNDRRCRRDAVRQAVLDVDSPELDVVYAERTGRTIPRVRVGRPIYR